MYYETLKEEIEYRESQLNQPDRATLNLIKYEAEIESMTSFYPILRSFIRYSSQPIDGEKLAAITVNKLKELTEV
jgi:hypothetical protein